MEPSFYFWIVGNPGCRVNSICFGSGGIGHCHLGCVWFWNLFGKLSVWILVLCTSYTKSV